MYTSIFYSIYKKREIPLILSFATYWRNDGIIYLRKVRSCLTNFILIMPLVSCGAHSWHSIEQTPATPTAYIRDGVFVSGDYVRSALIAEIDGKPVIKLENHLIEVEVGKHQIKILCNEAVGEYNTEEFIGQAKTLEFMAQIQRTYLVHCVPFTHWWIEDIENKAVVAGKKYN